MVYTTYAELMRAHELGSAIVILRACFGTSALERVRLRLTRIRRLRGDLRIPSGIFQSDSSHFWRETTRHAELVVQFQGFASLPLYSSMNSRSGFFIRLTESQSRLQI